MLICTPSDLRQSLLGLGKPTLLRRSPTFPEGVGQAGSREEGAGSPFSSINSFHCQINAGSSGKSHEAQVWKLINGTGVKVIIAGIGWRKVWQAGSFPLFDSHRGVW